MDYNEHLANGQVDGAPQDSPWHLPQTSVPVQAVMAAGRIEQAVEDATLGAFTGGVWRFYRRHPRWYMLLAFMIGGAGTSLAIMSTYTDWVMYSIDVYSAFWKVLFGGLGGAVAVLVIAVAYARSLRSLVRQPASRR